ncbi:MAG: hypothetical protein KC800_03640 [Candidatus Eremiobacteraeota bacterium]|nr:hypothetical protein [Candidatus Eremiobacteraeota bacterium]
MSKNPFKARACEGLLPVLLCLTLGGCTPKTGETVHLSPSPSGTTVATELNPASTATPEPSAPTSLFDGRTGDGNISLPGASLADIPTIESEVKRVLSEGRLQGAVGAGNSTPSAENFEVRAGGEGSFTRPDAQQKIFLYRFGLTNGLVVLEDSKVVAHYAGGPGDYAFYTYLIPRDVNADGLTDFILFRNVEDNDDIYAYLFLMTPSGPKYAGSTTVYSSTAQGGDGTDPATAESRAFEVTMSEGSPPSLTVSEFRRKGSGEWESSGEPQPFLWEVPKESDTPPILEILLSGGPDTTKIKSALDKLGDYADVPSSIDLGNPKNPAQTIVATDSVLQMMELLDTRAAVYAAENATKEQVDHSEVSKYALTLEGLGTADEIRDAYIKHTNESLGGSSPYADADDSK